MFILCFLSQAHPPQPRFTATLSEIRAAFRQNLMAAVHVVSMEIATLKGCREAFCFIKWLQGMTKRTWASGMKDVRSRFDLFTERPVEGGFFSLFFFF